MFQSTSIQEPSLAEQRIVSIIKDLEWVAKEYSWDFKPTISDLEFLYRAHVQPDDDRDLERILELVEEQAHLVEDSYLHEVA
jgi:hypothetical protein